MESNQVECAAFQNVFQLADSAENNSRKEGKCIFSLDNWDQTFSEFLSDGRHHEWGILSGLRVTATLGKQHVNVEPGVAIDVSWNRITLAPGDQAEVGSNAEMKAPLSDSLVQVKANAGVMVPTSGLSGVYYVTIQWWETFDITAHNEHRICRFFPAPWIRLIPIAEFVNDGMKVVLGKVYLDAVGNVIGLAEELRQIV